MQKGGAAYRSPSFYFRLFLVAAAVLAAAAVARFFLVVEVELKVFAAVRALHRALLEHLAVELDRIAAARAGHLEVALVVVLIVPILVLEVLVVELVVSLLQLAEILVSFAFGSRSRPSIRPRI